MNSDVIKNSFCEKRTDFLLPKRNFWTGFSSILDVFSNSNKLNTSKSGEEADYRALKSDWEMIGSDFRRVMQRESKFGNVD